MVKFRQHQKMSLKRYGSGFRKGRRKRSKWKAGTGMTGPAFSMELEWY